MYTRAASAELVVANRLSPAPCRALGAGGHRGSKAGVPTTLDYLLYQFRSKYQHLMRAEVVSRRPAVNLISDRRNGPTRAKLLKPHFFLLACLVLSRVTLRS
jgi:hypothetical protein